ncbi:hypothetical protein HF086_017218, partial [Spodoptera exigua]
EGGFPKELADKIAVKSSQQGYPRSRLPAFTDEEKAFVRGTSDFFGLNHYTGHLVSATTHKPIFPTPSLWDDMDVGIYKNASWSKSAASWLAMAPNSLYNVMIHLKARFNNPEIYVTENGWCTQPRSGLIDDGRIRYFRAALENVLDALNAGVNVKGYMAWSLMDNFEWLQGYTERYGLYQVNFSHPMRTRTPKKSAFVYKHIIKHRAVDYEYEPESMTMTIDEGH